MGGGTTWVIVPLSFIWISKVKIPLYQTCLSTHMLINEFMKFLLRIVMWTECQASLGPCSAQGH